MSSETPTKPTNRDLYLAQKKTLDLFVERGAISREQYAKSLRDLTAKMEFADKNEENTKEEK